MASDSDNPSIRKFDRSLQIELRQWASRQNLPRNLRAGLMLRAKELDEPQFNAFLPAGLTDAHAGVGGETSSVLPRLVEPRLEFGLLSLRWVS